MRPRRIGELAPVSLFVLPKRLSVPPLPSLGLSSHASHCRYLQLKHASVGSYRWRGILHSGIDAKLRTPLHQYWQSRIADKGLVFTQSRFVKGTGVNISYEIRRAGSGLWACHRKSSFLLKSVKCEGNNKAPLEGFVLPEIRRLR